MQLLYIHTLISLLYIGMNSTITPAMVTPTDDDNSGYGSGEDKNKSTTSPGERQSKLSPALNQCFNISRYRYVLADI